MKRALCLLLSVIMVAFVLAGCEKEYDEEIEIPIYLSSEVFNFDPAVAYTNYEAIQILGCIYEGLYKYNEKGKVEKALADTCTISEDEEKGIYKMTVGIKESCWSDGIAVTSDDFVYSVKRILEPDFYSEAASLLYDLKNARLAKSGDASIDDVGVYSVDSDTVEFVFEEQIDYEAFKEILCSPALYPLREDYCTKDPNWATCASTTVANGPFTIREFEYGKAFKLERNKYYHVGSAEDIGENATEFVIPYRIVVNYRLNAKNNFASYADGLLAYDGNIPLADRAEYAEAVDMMDMMSCLGLVFNTTKAPFDSADVRKALSMVLDRNAIVSAITFAYPAEGIVTYGVYDSEKGTSFREEGGALVSAEADVAGAKDLLKKAGVKGTDITLSIRNDDVQKAIAEEIKKAWKQLGFNVDIVTLKSKEFTEEESIYDGMFFDTYKEAYQTRNFDVIAVDYQMYTKFAFNALAPFAKAFSGGAMDMSTGEYLVKEHISGYNSDEYNQLIEEAFAEKDSAARAEILHRAEQKLLDDMPMIPVITYVDAYMSVGELEGIKDLDYSFGQKDFSRAILENYYDFFEAETE